MAIFTNFHRAAPGLILYTICIFKYIAILNNANVPKLKKYIFSNENMLDINPIFSYQYPFIRLTPIFYFYFHFHFILMYIFERIVTNFVTIEIAYFNTFVHIWWCCMHLFLFCNPNSNTNEKIIKRRLCGIHIYTVDRWTDKCSIKFFFYRIYCVLCCDDRFTFFIFFYYIYYYVGIQCPDIKSDNFL